MSAEESELLAIASVVATLAVATFGAALTLLGMIRSLIWRNHWWLITGSAVLACGGVLYLVVNPHGL